MSRIAAPRAAGGSREAGLGPKPDRDRSSGAGSLRESGPLRRSGAALPLRAGPAPHTVSLVSSGSARYGVGELLSPSRPCFCVPGVGSAGAGQGSCCPGGWREEQRGRGTRWGGRGLAILQNGCPLPGRRREGWGGAEGAQGDPAPRPWGPARRGGGRRRLFLTTVVVPARPTLGGSGSRRVSGRCGGMTGVVWCPSAGSRARRGVGAGGWQLRRGPAPRVPGSRSLRVAFTRCMCRPGARCRPGGLWLPP